MSRTRRKSIRENVQLPSGYQLIWSGQFEYMERVKERLFIVVPNHDLRHFRAHST